MSRRLEWVHAEEMIAALNGPGTTRDLAEDELPATTFSLQLTTQDGDGVVIYGTPVQILEAMVNITENMKAIISTFPSLS